MAEKATTKFKVPKFNGKNFAMWKVKIFVILINDGCVVVLKDKSLKLASMTDVQFVKKDEIA